MNGTVVEEAMDGIINIYKERGYTSHDVVAKLRGILHQKKIGHTGTLDPEAEGVLPVCLGKATKVCDLLTDWDKEYRAVLLLGVTTDTQDMTGTVLKKCPVFLHKEDDSKDSDALQLSKSSIRCCIDSFVGEIWQTPPMYSALKVNGKKLYELARQGIEVERQPRKIRIHGIQINNIDEKETPVIEIQLEVKCSKGTYIRTLCNDIGEKLGCGGCMASLLRTGVGPFHLDNTWRLSEVERLRDESRLEECLYPVDSVFADLDAVMLSPEAERLVRNGNPLSGVMMEKCLHVDHKGQVASDMYTEKAPVLRVYGQSREFLAIYEYNDERHNWRARKMFLS
ncbi:MAG: tRNA pseudouridine(55) synthase TruB [Clostridiales bacterium]|nr:tRNA pseudouridine(55) synthase TruB [Clostridiales bacterium]